MKIQNYIGGQFLEPASGQTLTNTNPATGEAYGTIPRSDAKDVELAVEAARGGIPGVERFISRRTKPLDVESGR